MTILLPEKAPPCQPHELVIAASPWIEEEGCELRRVVLRVHPLRGDGFVVHTQGYLPNWGATYSGGDYFTGVTEESLAAAWACFDLRSRSLLCIA